MKENKNNTPFKACLLYTSIFFGNRKLFDYYPLRMKLFDYRQWQQLTYPSMTDGAGKWETELDGIIRELMVQ